MLGRFAQLSPCRARLRAANSLSDLLKDGSDCHTFREISAVAGSNTRFVGFSQANWELEESTLSDARWKERLSNFCAAQMLQQKRKN